MSMNNIHEEVIVSWDQAMMTDRIPDLHKNIEQLIKLMTDGILNRDYENLALLFQMGTKRIEAWGNRLNFESHKEYYRVFSYAAFWISKQISERLSAVQKKERNVQKNEAQIRQLEHSKYMLPLLELLEVNGDLTQGTIAKRLSLSTQTLSNFLRRYEKYKFWRCEKYGRHNFYYLTNEGKNYLHTVRKTRYLQQTDLGRILTDMIDCIADECCKPAPDLDAVIHHMNQRFGTSQVVFGNEADKLVIRNSMRKLCFSGRHRERTRSHHKDDLPVFDLEEDDFRVMEEDDYREDWKEDFCVSIRS